MQYDPELMHLFITDINGVSRRDTTSYNDREFQMLMDRFQGDLPMNLRVHHCRQAPGLKNPVVLAMPEIPIPVYELSVAKSANVPEGLKLYRRRGPRSGVPVLRRYMDFVLAAAEYSRSGRLAYIDGRECSLLSRYTPVPLSLKQASEIVEWNHRHNSGIKFHKYSIALCSVEGRIVGVLIAGTPTARHQDDGHTLEIRRTCCDERYHNVCSALMGKAVRIGKELGYSRFLTYTLPDESGSSLSAAGFHRAGIVKGGKAEYAWDNKSRRRKKPARYPSGDKQRWILEPAA